MILRINIRLIIYLNDILIIGRSLEEILLSQDTVIFLLECLGFVRNLQESKFEPNTKIEFLGMEINSVDRTVYLPEGKIMDITDL